MSMDAWHSSFLKSKKVVIIKLVYCFSLFAVFKNSFLFIKTQVFVVIDSRGTINCDTFSVAPSVMKENLRNGLFLCWYQIPLANVCREIAQLFLNVSKTWCHSEVRLAGPKWCHLGGGGGKLSTPVCYLTKYINKAELRMFLSTNIVPLALVATTVF
jgi:hypothetical protein